MQRQMIAGQHLADAVGVAVGLLAQQRMRGGDHARRAEAALQRVMLAERRLQRRQVVVVRQALDRDDLGAFGLHREHQAGAHRLAVDQHGAGAADAVLAADMGAGQPQMMAQAIGERQARLDLDLDRLAVDFEFDRHGFHTLRRRGFERALDHGAGERAAIGGAGVDIVLRIDRGGRRRLAPWRSMRLVDRAGR